MPVRFVGHRLNGVVRFVLDSSVHAPSGDPFVAFNVKVVPLTVIPVNTGGVEPGLLTVTVVVLVAVVLFVAVGEFVHTAVVVLVETVVFVVVVFVVVVVVPLRETPLLVAVAPLAA
jgi:hypothetical protein